MGLAHYCELADTTSVNGISALLQINCDLTSGLLYCDCVCVCVCVCLCVCGCVMENHYGISSSDDLTHFTPIPGSNCSEYGPYITMPQGDELTIV